MVGGRRQALDAAGPAFLRSSAGQLCASSVAINARVRVASGCTGCPNGPPRPAARKTWRQGGAHLADQPGGGRRLCRVVNPASVVTPLSLPATKIDLIGLRWRKIVQFVMAGDKQTLIYRGRERQSVLTALDSDLNLRALLIRASEI